MAKRFSFKKFFLTLLKLTVVAGAFIYLLNRGQLNFTDLRSQFSYPGWLLLGIGGLLIPMLVSFYRHLLLLRALGINCYRFPDILRLGFIGCFFNTFMPGALGGDIIKAGYLIRDTGETSKSLASILVDRVLGLFGLLVVGGTAMIVARQEVMDTPDLHKIAMVVFGVIGTVISGTAVSLIALLSGRKIALLVWSALALVIISGCLYILSGADTVGWHWQFMQAANEQNTPELAATLLRGRFVLAALLALIVALLALIIVPSCQPNRRFSRFVKLRIPGGKFVMSFVEKILVFKNNLTALFWALWLSVITQSINVFGIYFFSRAVILETPPGMFAIFFAAPIAAIANSLPMPGGGLGVGEAVFASVLSLCRTGNGETIIGGATIFLTFRIWSIVISFCGGLPYYLRGKREIASIQDAVEHNAELTDQSELTEDAENSQDAPKESPN